MVLPVDLEAKIKEALERHLARADGVAPDRLGESIAYSLLSHGKRIRPRLLMSCAQMLGLSEQASLPAAIALEMIHCFTLIHDDLPCMDDDDFRRGQPSNHKKFDEATALLAGDALIPMAMECLLEAGPHVKPEALLSAIARLNWAAGARGVIAGQSGESTLKEDSRLEDLLRIHAQKTGALFSAALLMAKDLAGIDDESSQGMAIEIFARELGVAFQIADDLEDADGAPQPTSILFYLPAKEARTMALQRLRVAGRSLLAIWDEAAAPLLQIADEVARKLEAGAEEEPTESAAKPKPKPEKKPRASASKSASKRV
ncbi:MAG: polyprenyl synthetase family protein [Bdellovibrionota bacterium]